MAPDVAVFHPGVQHSWQTALALQDLGRLSFYATSIFYQPRRWPYRIENHLPSRWSARVHDEFLRFSMPRLDPDRVRCLDTVEWLERIARRLGRHGLAARLDRLGNRHFATALNHVVRREGPAMLWGYSGSALESFSVARSVGAKCVLDRTIGDWRAYRAAMAQVEQCFPEFIIPSRFAVSDAAIERDDAEFAAADIILTGSPFAAETVRVHATHPAVASRVQVLPYCFDEALFGPDPPRAPGPRDGPVRFLFLGQAGVRKGIHLVLEAIMRLPPSAAVLTIVGDLQIPPHIFARYADRVHYRPTVARRDVPAIMAEADVLLFPSYFEGSALSLIEGLAAGLALIQSPAAGLGVTSATGLMLPELSVDALHAAMATMVDDRGLLAAFQAAAPHEAANYRFSRYRHGIAAVLDSLA